MTERITFHAPDVAATLAAGRRLARCIVPGMTVTLEGDLGTGKTTFVRGLLAGLGWTGPVKSPTYSLVEHYQLSSLYFYHFDFYRLDDAEAWESAGFADYFTNDAVCVVEWPERVAPHLPRPDVAIRLAYLPAGPDAGREIAFGVHSAKAAPCLDALARPD